MLCVGLEPSSQPLWPAAGLNVISCPLSPSCRRAWRRSRRDPAGFHFTHGSTRWRAGRLGVHKHDIDTLRNTRRAPVHTERIARLAHLACVLPSSRRPLTWGFAQYFMGQVSSWHPIRTTVWVCVSVCVCVCGDVCTCDLCVCVQVALLHVPGQADSVRCKSCCCRQIQSATTLSKLRDC